MSDRRVRRGGLMRCCLASIEDYEGPEIPGETKIACKYHDKDSPVARIAKDGVWDWVGSPQS